MKTYLIFTCLLLTCISIKPHIQRLTTKNCATITGAYFSCRMTASLTHEKLKHPSWHSPIAYPDGTVQYTKPDGKKVRISLTGQIIEQANKDQSSQQDRSNNVPKKENYK